MLRDYLLETLCDQNGFETKGHQVDWENLRKDSRYHDLLDRILSMQVPARNRLELDSAQVNDVLVKIDHFIKTK